MAETTASTALLADLSRIPPAPKWFTNAIAAPYQTHWIKIDGISIEARSWGTPEKPGLIFIHGASAHLGWWSFFAPFFAEDFYVVTFSLGGMGRSGWRKAYSVANFAAETWAVADALGLSKNKLPPYLVAHSLGGLPAIYSSAVLKRAIRALILVDTALPAPGLEPPIYSGHKFYPTPEAALQRFRLAPPQPCEHLWIAEYLGRMGLKEVVDRDGKPAWTWCFDPLMLGRVELGDIWSHLRHVRDPFICINGELSFLTSAANTQRIKEAAPAGSKFMVMPEAHHHVMIDQPIATIAALRALLTP